MVCEGHVENRESDDSDSEEGTDNAAAPLNPQPHNIPTFCEFLGMLMRCKPGKIPVSLLGVVQRA